MRSLLNQEDIVQCCRQGIRHFTDSIRLPITKFHLQKIDEFIHNIGISQTTLNKDGDIDKLGIRLYQGVLMSYFVEKQPMAKVAKRTQIISGLLPITSSMKEDAGLAVLDKAATKFLNDGLISDMYDKMRAIYPVPAQRESGDKSTPCIGANRTQEE